MTSNQVVSTMFNIKTYIPMARFIQHRDWDEDPGLSIHPVKLLFPGYEGDHLSMLMYILSHRSRLYWSVAMFHHLVAPLCIFRGYDQFMSWRCCNNIEILAFGNLGEKTFVVFNYRKCRYAKTTICLSCASLNVLYLSYSVK
jgi:hypothetical protein